jgi:putative nucleotidyltransferase with HDIG domain
MTQETRRDLRFPALVVLQALVAAGVAWFAWQNAHTVSASQVAILVILLLAILVSESLLVLFPGSAASISMSYPLGIAIGVFFGAAYAAVAGAVSVIPLLFAKPRMTWDKIAFNAGQYVLTLAIPALVYERSARLLLSGGIRAGEFVGMVLPLTAAALIGVAVNSLLVSAGIKLTYGHTLRTIWDEALALTLPSQVVLGFVGIMIAQIVAAIGIPGLALFAVPLLVARQTYQQSAVLEGAYADTIGSLVAALEAKDLYTKGHSVRVAEYTVMIAESMGLTPERIRRVEYAALLHDIGKVGVSRRVLSKESRLSDEEYAEIKRHPGIGAHIVADVPYLADLVPFIERHHERLDGKGYGQGVQGEDIPLEARILSVADSYDAMTSVRPYRGAMSHEAAFGELHAGCGTQFDPEAVAAFEHALSHAASTAEDEVSTGDA